MKDDLLYRSFEDLMRRYYGRPAAPRRQAPAALHPGWRATPKPEKSGGLSVTFSVDDGLTPAVLNDDSEEYVVPDPPAAAVPVAPPTPAPPAPEPAAVPAVPAPPPPTTPPTTAPPVPPAAAEATVPQATVPAPSDDDFAADMRSIRGSVPEPEPLPAPAAAPPPAPQPAPPPPVEPSPTQAIFDRLAQSMTYANSYDLGTVEMDNRFADFDRLFDEERRQDPAPVQPPQPVQPTPVPDLSHPLYDTGEHVRTGGDLYVDRLRAGRSPGVTFSYGQLIAMPDLYASVAELASADPAELTTIKDLVARSTRYDEGGRREPALDVTTLDWNSATHGRYLRLAEDNAEHFAPAALLGDPAPADARNHRDAWETHHRQAIGEARRAAAETPDASVLPEWALVVNAFGDHFLTDAFAAGHLFNRAVLAEKFAARFYRDGDFTDAARDFFTRVAGKATIGALTQKFSVLQGIDHPVKIWGLTLPLQPTMFTTLIEVAARTKPDLVAGLVAKALHDHLNRTGVTVTNEVGDGPWRIYGDGHLDPVTLGVMRRAVQQSVADVNEAMTATLDVDARCAAVWRHTPRPIPDEVTRLRTLMTQFTDPASAQLADAVAELIRNEVDSLITSLINGGRPA
ncbi:hypothetical protein GCM10010166_44910 [Couchioplanes caeruleus subsp. azureus]|nr:hypothetical protein GCM10010166_44910 [Couchioplanes caeruleus subsp. azureus]